MSQIVGAVPHQLLQDRLKAHKMCLSRYQDSMRYPITGKVMNFGPLDGCKFLIGENTICWHGHKVIFGELLHHVPGLFIETGLTERGGVPWYTAGNFNQEYKKTRNLGYKNTGIPQWKMCNCEKGKTE